MARIHNIERTALAPAVYRAPRDGLVIARHLPSLVQIGDCLFVIGEII